MNIELGALDGSLLYEEKVSCLRREIVQLRKLFVDMKRDRELLKVAARTSQVHRDGEIASLRSDMDRAQTCLKETQSEVAVILENHYLEMEMLQRERDDAVRHLHQAKKDAMFFSSYNKFLEEKLCNWIDTLEKKYLKIEKKAEEMAEVGGKTRVELERVRGEVQHMNQHLKEVPNADAQLALMKEDFSRALRQTRELFDRRVAEDIADAQAQLQDALQHIVELTGIVVELKEDTKNAEQNAEYAVRKHDAALVQMEAANMQINELQNRVSTLELALQKRNGIYCDGKHENDTVAQHCEAPMHFSGLNIRISLHDPSFASRAPDHHNKNLETGVETQPDTTQRCTGNHLPVK